MAAPARGGARTALKSAIPQIPWSAARPAPIVLVTGPETVLAERAIRALREQLKAADPSLEVSDIDAGSYAPGELITLASPSLFGEPRLIRVTGVEKATDAFIADALDYLAVPDDGTTVVLRHGGGMRGKKLLDEIRAGRGGGVEVVCAELKRDSDKYDFARDEFKRAGKRITGGALRAVVSAFADDLAELASACQQLISDSAAEIDEKIVDNYYGGRVEVNAFAVADAAIAGRYGEALVTLRHALASGADPVPMVAAFASKVRTMAKLKGSRGADGQLASQFGLSPWQVKRAREDLQGWDEPGLVMAIQALAAADSEVKGGSRDAVFALERLVRTIAAKGRVAR
ncbi:MAG: DNA polymerase III subunit delta [Microbacteriaceae bacterium]|nr:DNA polymerase III subunit delta [Microbacteriaceae bacterium]MCL2795966.1 DNA polymerase III subunit delta [Microbacteriaceae bacterium]